jgi:hypothetical protein
MMMKAARTSETSVDNYFTRQYIPEDNSELHTRRRENLKSHIVKNFLIDLVNTRDTCWAQNSSTSLLTDINYCVSRMYYKTDNLC